MAYKEIVEKLGSTVNISGFHIAELKKDEAGQPFEYDELKHIRGAQDIKVETTQETIKNWGDGEVQEKAVSQGETKVDLQAFAIPLAVRAWLAGHEVDENGIVTMRGGVLNPPSVGCIFYKERINKDVEVVGFTNGVFEVGGDEGKTAEDKTDFSNQDISGEFSQRLSDGITGHRAIIKKDDKASLDAFFTKIFGKTAPTTALPKGWTGAVAVTPETVPAG